MVSIDVADHARLSCTPNKTVGQATFPSALVTLFEVSSSGTLLPVSKDGEESYFGFAAAFESIEPQGVRLSEQGSITLTIRGIGFEAKDLHLYQVVIGRCFHRSAPSCIMCLFRARLHSNPALSLLPAHMMHLFIGAPPNHQCIASKPPKDEGLTARQISLSRPKRAS